MQQNNPFIEQQIDIREYVRVLYERKWVIISFTFILCTLAFIRSFMMDPVYTATTRVLIEREAPRIVKIEEVAASDFSAKEYYQTQYNILKSQAIAKRVVKALRGYQPWNEWTGRGQKGEESLTDQKRMDSLLSRIIIRPIPNTQLVEINVDDVEPELSARIANLWAETYISYVLDTKFEATQYASGWLQEKIKEAKDNLEGSELRLQEYRRQNNIVETEGISSNSPVLEGLLKRKSELEIEISEKSEHFRTRHPEIIGLSSELDSVKKRIDSETDKVILSKDKEIRYNMLKREVESNKEIYESLLKRIRETEITGELKTTNIRVIDRASVPAEPSRPRKKISLLIAFLVGMLGGSVMAFVLESLDQSVKTPEDVKNHIKLPVLATIALPREREDKKVKPEIISAERPHSTISESYLSLRTSIIFTAVEHRRKILLFTSSGPQEGKTTTAINLAIAMAQAGEKVLLLDADLRQPRVESVFDFGIEYGVTEILVGSEDIDSVVHETWVENLYLLASGRIPPNPSELIGSTKMRELLAELEKSYDRIIIDSPPALAVTDSVILSGMVDGTIVVIKSGDTNRNAVLKTKEMIEEMKNANLIGAVLTMVDTKNSGGHYYYHRYYGKKHGHYGKNRS
jgi:polysaccharide biosynthesis transport protein